MLPEGVCGSHDENVPAGLTMNMNGRMAVEIRMLPRSETSTAGRAEDCYFNEVTGSHRFGGEDMDSFICSG